MSDIDERQVDVPGHMRDGLDRGAPLGAMVPVDRSAGPVRRPWTAPGTPGEQLSLSTALVGLPNAGKSTLLNSLVGCKVSASSNKRHTTSQPVTGVVTDGRAQLVLTDTPGSLDGAWARDGALEAYKAGAVKRGREDAASALDGTMHARAGAGAAAPLPSLRLPSSADPRAAASARKAVSALGGSDVALVVVDGARRVDADGIAVVDRAVAACAAGGSLPLLVVTKADLLVGATGAASWEEGMGDDEDVRRGGGVSRAGRGRGAGAGGRRGGPAGSRQDGGAGAATLQGRVDDLSDALEQSMVEWGLVDARGLDALPLPHVHVVSARTGGGMGLLRRTLLRMAVPRAWAFGRDAVTDRTGPELAEELIREKVFRATQDEVPYRLGVEVRSWAEAEQGALVVVHADVVAGSAGHAAMLTARGGAPLRAMAKGAERDLGKAMGRRARVLLHVSVSASRLRRLAAAQGRG